MTIVPGAGRTPNRVMLVGEAPGREEASYGIPFVGKSGQAQDDYLARHHLTTRPWFRTNVVKQYIDGNPDPTPELIDHWTPTLLAEVVECNPSLIIAVGAYAARFFLGESATMGTVHGLPHRAGALDPVCASRAPVNCTILPVTHPASGFYKIEARTDISRDYAAVAAILDRINRCQPIDYREDPFVGHEQYVDVTGGELAASLAVHAPDVISIDTEGWPNDLWSIQVTIEPGSAYVLRYSQPDFAIGIEYLQFLVDQGITIVTHQASTPTRAMWDNHICRLMGLELRDANLFDTMYWAYVVHEVQGLKPLAYRRCGMHMVDYESVLGGIARDKQIAYLTQVESLTAKWPKPDPVLIHENDGTSHFTKPQSPYQHARGILRDIANGKVNKDGEPVDPFIRWHKEPSRRGIRREIERYIGKMPIATLDDVPLAQAIHYAGRDSDATMRVYLQAHQVLVDMRLTKCFNSGMPILRIVDEMSHYGMPASISKFRALHADCESEITRLQSHLSRTYCGGRPINPNSGDQIAALMAERNLRAFKTTAPSAKYPQGRPSTDKKSIEYLRTVDEAISCVFDCREVMHIRDKFCNPVLELADDRDDSEQSNDIISVKCVIKSTRTHTRRFSSIKPNLLAMPTRKDFGRRVRSCYICPPGQLFGAYDQSQIEMRIVADESNDLLMLSFFNSKRADGSKPDMHKETVMRIRNISAYEVTGDERSAFKSTGFGILYGMGDNGLDLQLKQQGIDGYDKRSCQKLINDWLNLYSGVHDYIEQVKARAFRDGYVRDRSGMIRYLPAIYDRDQAVSSEAGRHAVSQIIQGSAQTTCQNSMIWLDGEIRDLQRAGHNVHWVLQVHDELILQFDEYLADTVSNLAIEALTCHSGIKLKVPIEAEGHVADSWGKLK